MWANVGTLGEEVDITAMTGSVEVTSCNAKKDLVALCFAELQLAPTIIDFDTNSGARPELTMELWLKPSIDDDSLDWLLAHDDGGYDRAIITRDSRFGGTAAGVGTAYSSSVSYPAVDEWSHIVVTYSKATGQSVIYKNGGGSVAGGEQQTVNVASDSQSTFALGLNAPPTHAGHSFVGCIA